MDLKARYKMLPDHRCIISLKDSIPKRMQSSSVSCDTLSGHAHKYRVNFISLLMKSTFLPMNSKMSMSKPEERVLQPMDL